MRKDNAFVVLLVALCMGLATMAAVSSSPTNGEKEEFEGFDSLDEATVTENWKRYFPAQYEGWTRTAEMQQTTYGGGGHAEAEGMEIHKIDYLEKYPFLKVAYDGFGFSKGFYRSRGHIHALNDIIDTERLPDWDKRPATCIGCKTTDVTKLDAIHGDDWYSMPFSKVIGTNTIGCLDCHSPEDASIRHARTWLDEGMAHGTFANIDPEGRTDLVCAQCHTNYHFNADTRKVELPWTTGLHVEAQLEHYDAARRSDEWIHPRTGALVAKMQHPEFELYTEGKEQNIHSQMGLQCTDCHMPKAVEADGEEYTYHHWTSPLTHVENSCLGCHSDWGADGVIERAEGVQSGVYEKQNRIGEDLAVFIDAIAAKRDNGAVDEVTMTQLQKIHREAQFYWDFIWVENSEGFHNWAEAHRVLDKADALIKEGMEVIDGV